MTADQSYIACLTTLYTLVCPNMTIAIGKALAVDHMDDRNVIQNSDAERNSFLVLRISQPSCYHNSFQLSLVATNVAQLQRPILCLLGGTEIFAKCDTKCDSNAIQFWHILQRLLGATTSGVMGLMRSDEI